MGTRVFTTIGLPSTLLGGACLLTTLPGVAQAQATPAPTQSTPSAVEEVIVTGYRRSLEDAATAKRESTNFTDSVFAEDIGKFPDLNIAESLQRVPGVQLVREVNGEGLNIAIRGLGTNFTKVTLNGAQIAVASTGPADAQNSNRELDLDLFPTELFTRLDVSKSPRASLIEGGVAGTVSMRSARPFDNPGTRFSYQLQTGYGEVSTDFSPRGALTAQWTNDTFGALVGLAGVHNKATTEGFETIGWGNMIVPNYMCGSGGDPLAVAAACNTTGGSGSGWSPGRPNPVPPGGTSTRREVPRNAGAGLVEGTTLTREFFETNNPGLTLEQISNAIIPRLGRPHYSEGDRDRVSALVSFEYRPLDNLSFYLDTLWADAERKFDRLDVNFVGRSGASIPLNLEVDANGVVQRGTFANAQFFLEARPFDEEVDFYNLNPGMHFQMNEWLGFDFQLNKTRSTFFRESPTVLVNTPSESNHVVEFVNGDVPTFTSNQFDLNDPNIGWVWAGGRVNLQAERRVTETEGAHLDVTVGSPDLNVVVGGAFDDISRDITALDNSRRWQQAVCGGGGAFIDVPGTPPPCNGQAGSLVPQSALAGYLMPGPGGFITVDLERFKRDTGYYELLDTAPVAQAANTQAPTGFIREKTTGGYLEFNGRREVFGHMLRVNAGARYVTTDQTIRGPLILNGVIQPDFQELLSDYNKVLPSFNAAFNATDNIVLRAGASRTLTRANPSFMLPATTVTDTTANNARQGNPDLAPFISDNIDLGGEWYTGNEGFVGLNLFQKEIANFTFNGVRTIPFRELGFPFEALNADQQRAINGRGGPDAALIDVSQQVNSPGELQIRGYEVTWVQPLGQFVDALDGFGFNANYTRVTQKAKGEGVPAFAQGVSPHTYNATAYYERGGGSIRLSYTWGDEQINSDFNEQGITLARRYVDARGQLDLSASYEFANLPTSPMITLNIINLTSQEQRQTFQFDSATFTYYEPGYNILLGVRGKF
jgi:TonB-dependent receptor